MKKVTNPKGSRVMGMAGVSFLALIATAPVRAADSAAAQADPVAVSAAPPAAAPANDSDIVVTATRRETQLMRTPVAITAVTAKTLEQQNIVNVSQLEKVVPNLKIQDSSTLGMGALQLSMRGIGNSNYTEQGDPNVGLHVDGVYMSRPQAAWNLMFDVDRVEVLRGPQGTLFGRNSTVGSINIINTRPKLGVFEGKGEAQYGRFNDTELRGALNVPITNTLAVRVTGFYQKRDTDYHLNLDNVLGTVATNPYLRLGDPTSKSHGAGSLDHNAFRASILWEPIPDASIYASYEKYNNNSPAAPLTVRDHPYTAYLNTPNITNMDINTIRVEARYKIADAVDVKYTFGRTHYTHDILLDLDAGVSHYKPSDAPGTDQQFFWDRPFRNHSRSHELQLSSAYDSRLQWVLGYFNFREDTLRDLWIDLPLVADGLIDFYQPDRRATSQAFFGTADYAFTDKFRLKAGGRYSRDRKTDTNGSRQDSFPGDGARARFGVPVFLQEDGVSDIDYISGRNTDGLPTIDRATGFPADPGTPNYQIAQLAGTTPQVFDRLFNNDKKWRHADFSVTASYQANDDTYLYGTVATGYKSGTFQDTYFLPRNYQVYRPILKPEKLTNFEAGIKERFDIGGGHANLSATGFYMNYRNKQEAILVDFGDQFCGYTFGDFNGDGYVESFVPGLTNVPIFSQTRFNPATLKNNPTPDEIKRCAQTNFDTPQMQNSTELVPINLAAAHLGGIEVEFNWMPTQNDRINGFATSMLVNKISKIDGSQLPFPLSDSLACGDRAGGCPTILDAKGNKLPFAASFTANLAYSHDFHFADGGQLTPWIQANYSSSYYLTLFNVHCYQSIASGGQVCNNGDYQKGYATIDMTLRYTPSGARWYAEAYGYNITGTTYATFNRRNGNDFVTGYAMNPRTSYGVRVGFKF